MIILVITRKSLVITRINYLITINRFSLKISRGKDMNKEKLVHIALLFFIASACNKQPTEVEIKYPYEPAQWYQTPTWSPDGEWIAFTFYKTIPESIHFVRPDGSEMHPVVRGYNSDFSPDGTKLALNIGNQIYTYNLQTDNLKQITFNGSNYYPRWSPNGKRIVFDSNFQDPKGANVIWLMNPDGSNRVDISQHGIGEWRQPDWLPDFRILHIRYASRSSPDLFIMDSTGNEEIRLTTQDWNQDPKVSPDNSKIIWQRWNLQSKIDIWMMNIDGSNKIKLVDGGREPSWSPDGSKIVFWKYGIFTPGEPWDDDDPEVRGSLWVLDLSTMEQRQVLP